MFAELYLLEQIYKWFLVAFNAQISNSNTFVQLIEMCKTLEKQHPVLVIFITIINLSNKLYLLALVVVWSMLTLKSSNDILQGLSKLDYYLVVSVFQVYKNN